MQLILYTTESAENVINKTLANPLLMNINLRRGMDISNPVLRLKFSGSMSQYNYAHIPEFNRYYFITDVESVNSNIWSFRLSVDVIESFKSEILSSFARYNRNLRTGDYQAVSLGENVKTDVSLFESSMGLPEGSTMIMTTIGEGE